MGAPARVTGFPPVAAGGRRPEREVQEAGKAIEDPSLSPQDRVEKVKALESLLAPLGE